MSEGGGVVPPRRSAPEDRVAPWAVWPDGQLPEEWWTADEFIQATARWAGFAWRDASGALILRLPQANLEAIVREMGSVLEEPSRRQQALWDRDP